MGEDEDHIVVKYCLNYFDLPREQRVFIREQMYRKQLCESHGFCPQDEELQSRDKVSDIK